MNKKSNFNQLKAGYTVKKSALVIMMGVLLLSFAVSQTPSSAVWPLTVNKTAIVTGDVTASDQSLSNMQVQYASGVQRSSPSGTAGTWPAESAENTTRYMQFAVMPDSHFEFAVTSVSLILYVNSGSGMSANVYFSTDSTFMMKTKIGSTFGLSSSVPASANVNAAPGIVVPSGSAFYVRIYPWYNTSTTGKYVIANSVTIAGTTHNATAPIITTSASSLPNFGSAVIGTTVDGGTYSVSAINLLSDLVVKAPTGFKVSKDSSTYADSIIFTHVGGIVSPTEVYTRFAPDSASGFLEGFIEHTSIGATAKNIDVAGVSLAAEPTTQSTISFGAITGNSIEVNISGGNGNGRILVARKDSTVTFSPHDGTEYSGVDSSFSVAVDQGNGNRVLMNGNISRITITGLSVASTYHFAVYEFNAGTGNSYNFRSSEPGRGNAVTLSVPGLNVVPATLSFGNIVVNSTSSEKIYLLSGSFLQPASGNIILKAPAGFQISETSSTGFDSSISIAYSGAKISAKSIFVRFMPAIKTRYSGSVTNEGGGAASISVSVSGTGVDQIFVPDSIPFGFASLGGGTTGGKGGTETIITTPQQMADIMLPREKSSDPQVPIILYITGTLSGYADAMDIKRTKNISIIGVGNDAKIQGFGFKIVESSNIIIRNITFADAKAGEKDALSVEESHNVWIDHCSFTDSPSIDIGGSSHDGQLDVKKGSYNVTLSYNYFTNHRKTSLFGHSTSETGDVAMRVTYYRNWFDGTYSRHPRARYGKAHILNNLYTGVGVVGADMGGYAVGSTCSAHLLVEGNYFENTSRPTLISQVNDPGETLSGDPAGFLKALNNHTVGSGPIVENLTGYDFDPSESYPYTPLDAQLVKDLVTTGAGAGKLNGGITGIFRMMTSSPGSFELHQNYPNPFNPSTTISFVLPEMSFVTLKVFDMLGREVATLVQDLRSPGLHNVWFNADRMTTGVYFYTLYAGNLSATKKLLFVK